MSNTFRLENHEWAARQNCWSGVRLRVDCVTCALTRHFYAAVKDVREMETIIFSMMNEFTVNPRVTCIP